MIEGSKSWGPIIEPGFTMTASRPRSQASSTIVSPIALELVVLALFSRERGACLPSTVDRGARARAHGASWCGPTVGQARKTRFDHRVRVPSMLTLYIIGSFLGAEVDLGGEVIHDVDAIQSREQRPRHRGPNPIRNRCRGQPGIPAKVPGFQHAHLLAVRRGVVERARCQDGRHHQLRGPTRGAVKHDWVEPLKPSRSFRTPGRSGLWPRFESRKGVHDRQSFPRRSCTPLRYRRDERQTNHSLW